MQQIYVLSPKDLNETLNKQLNEQNIISRTINSTCPNKETNNCKHKTLTETLKQHSIHQLWQSRVGR